MHSVSCLFPQEPSGLPGQPCSVLPSCPTCILLLPHRELFAHLLGSDNGYSSKPTVLWNRTMLILWDHVKH